MMKNINLNDQQGDRQEYRIISWGLSLKMEFFSFSGNWSVPFFLIPFFGWNFPVCPVFFNPSCRKYFIKRSHLI